MGKQKKKNNNKQQQQMMANFHNEYRQQMNKFLISIGLTKGLEEFEDFNQQSLLASRIPLPKVYVADDCEISKEALSDVKFLIHMFLNDTTLGLGNNRQHHNLAMFMNFGLHFYCFLKRLKIRNYPDLQRIQTQTKEYYDEFPEFE